MQSAERNRQRGPVRVAKSNVVEAGRAGWRRATPARLPRVQTDVMMVSPGTKERSIIPHPLRHLESQHIGVEADGPLQIRDLEVNVTDNRCRIYGGGWWRLGLVAHGSRAFG